MCFHCFLHKLKNPLSMETSGMSLGKDKARKCSQLPLRWCPGQLEVLHEASVAAALSWVTHVPDHLVAIKSLSQAIAQNYDALFIVCGQLDTLRNMNDELSSPANIQLTCFIQYSLMWSPRVTQTCFSTYKSKKPSMVLLISPEFVRHQILKSQDKLQIFKHQIMLIKCSTSSYPL